MLDTPVPERQTEAAILQKKAEDANLQIPLELCAFIVERTNPTIGGLDALVRLVAYASLTNRPISLGLAQEVLKDRTSL